MEYRKLVAFSVKCNKCLSEWSVSEKEFSDINIICQRSDCDNSFTVYEGIRNSLKSDDNNEFIPNAFMANDLFNGVLDLKLGYSKDVEFPTKINNLKKVQIIPMGSFYAGATEVTSNGFKVLTSFIHEGTDMHLGDDVQAFYMVSAQLGHYEEPWMQMLSSALSHLKSEEYLSSIMLSEIAFEAFIDRVISQEYLKKGLDEDSISRLMIATQIPIKVNPLMYNLFGVKLASFAQTSRNWENKVLKWRNKIAHGTKAHATKEEARVSYDTVVDAIFQFIEELDKLK